MFEKFGKAPAIFASIEVFLALTLANANIPDIMRLKVGQVALVILNLFFYSLLREEIDRMKEGEGSEPD